MRDTLSISGCAPSSPSSTLPRVSRKPAVAAGAADSTARDLLFEPRLPPKACGRRGPQRAAFCLRRNERAADRRKRFFSHPCEFCGSFDHLEADHIDPRSKHPSLRRRSSDMWRMGEKSFAIEIAKCRVLCKKCHTKRHADMSRFTSWQHGTRYGYASAKCRCELCRDWSRRQWHVRMAGIPHKSTCGENNYRAKFTNAQVLSIVQRCRNGETARAVAIKEGVSPSTIGMIMAGLRWSSVTGIVSRKLRPSVEAAKRGGL